MAAQLQTPPPVLIPEDQEERSDLHSVEDASIELAAPQPKRSLLAKVKSHQRSLFIAAVIVALVLGVASWIYFSSYESTDDAQVDGHLHPISARISGTILRVNPDVQDSHFVQAGTVLAEIDPADFQAERDRAQADDGRLAASS